ncbi:MAG: META domain-containing protein [Thermoflexales bacterium]|nr:META domain-containing protein [Thermoflexales bacterium]
MTEQPSFKILIGRALLATLVLASALAACTAGPGAAGPGGAAAAPLAGTVWTIAAVEDGKGNLTPVLPGPALALTFDTSGRVGGQAGCNSFGGGYSQSGAALAFARLTSTLRACADEARMEQESRLLAAMGKVAGVDATAEGVRLLSASGQPLLLLKKP